MSNSSYLLLVETSAIISTDPNTWQAIAKLGECLVPEVVAIEIKNIANGKAEGNESNAKQFQNSSNLNWQITALTAKHADLVRTTQNLSRKAKLMMNVAQSAVGVANAHPKQCVVLISDEISLRDRIAKLDCKNLCSIPSAVARQWSRTEQAPPIVDQSIKYLQKQIDQSTNQLPHQTDTIGLDTAISVPTAKQKNTKIQPKVKPNHRHIAISLVKFGLATAFLVTILLFGWSFAQPKQFQQFWKKTGLPHFPKILAQPNQAKKN